MPSPVLENMELIEIIRNVISIFEQEGVTIQFDSTISSLTIVADKDQIIRAINNLLQNSIQAFDSKVDGVIEIKLEVEYEFCKITISDNGKGIPEDRQNKVFVPYFTTKSTGTGIGLSITKQIIENHNGKIYFESKENIGTSFYLELPLPELKEINS
jgi:signal transduction histidine kinase